ncbi:hypothetical protein Pan181_26440 [Aeoliella mucimassa]|uniref:Uncharacterized protein n=1 Tax=Aeoliella mucimassa TaxID=2527972 RepID=A0A518ANY5_9BACT|nr:hypothetical protein Pan181_26440 [Aeoliella mucimassa]
MFAIAQPLSAVILILSCSEISSNQMLPGLYDKAARLVGCSVLAAETAEWNDFPCHSLSPEEVKCSKENAA